MTQKPKFPEQKALKKALKTLNFWYKVLLESEHMDDVENRKEFQRALLTIETVKKGKRQ